MPQSSFSEDIKFVRQMAEEGASAPPLTGRFSVWWGLLVTAALIAHWAVLQGMLPLAEPQVGVIWFGMGIVGLAGQFLLGRGMREKPGGSAPGNRAASAIWSVIGPGIFLYVLAIVAAVVLRKQSPELFNTIMPMAFLLYAVAAACSAALFRSRAPWGVVAVCLIASALTMFMINMPEAYLVAAAGVMLSQVIPGFQNLHAEPKSVV